MNRVQYGGLINDASRKSFSSLGPRLAALEDSALVAAYQAAKPYPGVVDFVSVVHAERMVSRALSNLTPAELATYRSPVVAELANALLKEGLFDVRAHAALTQVRAPWSSDVKAFHQPSYEFQFGEPNERLSALMSLSAAQLNCMTQAAMDFGATGAAQLTQLARLTGAGVRVPPLGAAQTELVLDVGARLLNAEAGQDATQAVMNGLGGLEDPNGTNTQATEAALSALNTLPLTTLLQLRGVVRRRVTPSENLPSLSLFNRATAAKFLAPVAMDGPRKARVDAALTHPTTAAVVAGLAEAGLLPRDAWAFVASFLDGESEGVGVTKLTPNTPDAGQHAERLREILNLWGNGFGDLTRRSAREAGDRAVASWILAAQLSADGADANPALDVVLAAAAATKKQ
jgi:hypothetical protein